MSILTTDLKLMGSVHTAASIKSLGGAIDTANEVIDGVLHNLFDRVTADESLAGDTEYRCIYLRNTHTTITLELSHAYISTNTASVTTDISIGVGTSGVGSTEQIVLNEETAPTGIVWENLTGLVNKVALGDIPPGSHRAIWIRRVVGPNTVAAPLDGITLVTRGSTV